MFWEIWVFGHNDLLLHNNNNNNDNNSTDDTITFNACKLY